MDDVYSFGAWVRLRRQALLLSREELARQVGVAEVGIRKIEADGRCPSLQVAALLAQALRLAPERHEVFVQVARGILAVDQLPALLSGRAMPPVDVAAAPAPAPNALPSGTVTFLFTDIEGSTPLWEHEPEQMRLALAHHHAILRTAIAAYEGHAYKLIGDAFQAAFVFPMHAVAAALAAQRALAIQAWETSVPLRVRMGIHVGSAVADGTDYSTTHTLNRVARIMAAGHGGQILLSGEVADLVRRDLPTDVTLRDMGKQRMKGLTHLEHLFQVVTPDLPAAFPPLTTLDTFRTNLPVQLTSFVGREQAITDVTQLLTISRLVTLTGPGGTGKTRLALQVAAELALTPTPAPIAMGEGSKTPAPPRLPQREGTTSSPPLLSQREGTTSSPPLLPQRERGPGGEGRFPDGVWLIELAPLADAALVPRAVASALGLREDAGRPVLAALTDFLRARNLLLILDNCEHVVEACAQLAAALLRGCLKVRILASSREALGIAGEAPFRVPSLATPDPRHLPPIETLAHYEAVRLFVERAATVLPGFTLTPDNAPAVAQVCSRLDGIPLALELAAARVNVLRVEQIAARLDDRFRLLTGGSRTAVPRQQTLRALIDWSYDLLADAERVLLRRLAVFAGGWTLAATEAVCAGDGLDQYDVLDVLTQLVNKSLVVAEREQGQETRYRLLETIRQYALERLAASGAADAIRRQHLAYFVQLAERAEPNLRAFEMVVWLDRLEAELDNLRTALEWGLETDVEAALRLAGALWWFWHLRGHGNEGCDWLERALSIEMLERGEQPIWPARAMIRGKALNLAGFLSLMPVETEKGAVFLMESLAIFRKLGPAGKRGMAYALWYLAWVAAQRQDRTQEKSLVEESLALFREVGDTFGMAECLLGLGNDALADGDHKRARTIWEENLALRKEIGDKDGIALAYRRLGGLAFGQGDYQRATTLYEESLAGFREVGNKTFVADTLGILGEMARIHGDYDQAAKMHETALAIGRESGDEFAMAVAIHDMGTMAWAQGDYEQAAKMFEQELTIGRGMRNRIVLPNALFGLAGVARSQGDYDQAANMYTELMAFGRWKPDALDGLGRVARSRGEYASARALHAEALAVWQAAGLRFGVPLSLEALASLATAQQQAARAARLFGAAEALQEVFFFILAPADRADHDRDLATVRAALGEAAFAAVWAEGRAMTSEQAIEYALARSRP